MPAGRAAAWISNALGVIPLGILCFLFLLFPTGHLKSSRWRVAAWFVAGAFTLANAFFLLIATVSWDDPYAPPPPGGSPWWLLLPVSLLAALALSVAAVIVRFRGSVGEERLQLQWFATGASVFIVLFIPTFASTAPVWLVVQSLAFVFLFTTIAVAVLKYRLYDLNLVISKTVLYGSLAAFLTVVYLAVVIGLGTAVGSTHNPFLTVAAATVIAVAFNPMRERAKRLADRLVYGRRATPYEVLSEFSERMVGTYDLDEILPRMARVLAEGTGAARRHLVAGRQPAASGGGVAQRQRGVAGARAGRRRRHARASDGVERLFPVRHQGELLGAITLTKPPNDPLRPPEAKLIDDVASQAGLVMFNVRLIEELRASRQRLVKAQDEERRRLERNIHDGAQQQLVALAVKANLAQSLATRDPAATETMLAQLKADATDALENLRDLARGIYPPLLADKGLVAALESQAEEVGGAGLLGVRRHRALPTGGRGRGLLLLSGGAAERRQVRGREQSDDPTHRQHGRAPYSRSSTTAQDSIRDRPATARVCRGWRTASTLWADTSRCEACRAQARPSWVDCREHNPRGGDDGTPRRA